MTGPKHTRLLPPADLPALARKGQLLAEKAQAPCALIGGVAVQAYGLSRATKDVDFAVTREGLANLERALREANIAFVGLKIGGISLEDEGGAIDFIDRRFGPFGLFEEAIAAAKRANSRVEADGLPVLVVPVEYLVALKMVAARPQDDADLDFLLRLADLDYAEARRIVAQHLGDIVARYLDRAARLAGRRDVPQEYDDSSGKIS